ncbi:MAG: hypothetical protein IPH12_01425 [Saprospirales bacterium]|nr:hypothetical protein [Saprospirales bacterium]
MKTISFWTGAALLLFAIALPAQRANILTGESVRIAQPVDGNVYAGAGEITIDAVVNGDVTAGAGELRVSDTIRRDLIVGGGRVRVDGVIGEDLRCGGGEVTLLGNVLGDVVVGCGQLEIGRDAVIYGDLVVGGGKVRVYGRVMGSVILAGGEVGFEGTAEKDAEIRGGDVRLDGVFRGPCKIAAETIELGAGAAFYQPVRYWQKAGELDFTGHLREGATAAFDTGLRQDMRQTEWQYFSRGLSVFFLFRLLAGSVLIVILLLLFERFFRRAGEGLPAQWLHRFGMGMLYLIGLPVAVIFLFISVIGIPVGLFALFFYLFSLLFAPSLSAAVAANAVEQYQGYTWNRGQRILAAMGLLAAVHLLSWIPFIGVLLTLVVIGIALGGIAKALVTRPAEGF